LWVGDEGLSIPVVVGVASRDPNILEAFVGDAVGNMFGAGPGFGAKFIVGKGLFVDSLPPWDEEKDINPVSSRTDPISGEDDSLLLEGGGTDPCSDVLPCSFGKLLVLPS
jgi:hypothetical protein